MGDLVNLNHYRKQRQREQARLKAASNRLRHGASKSERRGVTGERERRQRQHDGKRIETDTSDEPPTAS